jgi:phosphonate transport system substrate-binding protein
MSKPSKLQAVSYLAPNWFGFYQAVTAYLGRVLQIEIHLTQGDCDPLEDPLLNHDELDLAFICGLPFIRYHHISPEQLRAIAAPIMQASRYQQHPVYFSDVIVNAASELNAFANLAGKTVCYNDPGSNSGYYLLCHRLLQEENCAHFFSHAIQSGSHQRSIQWVIEGRADCAAVDSTVLEQELEIHPELAEHIRIIESIGPCAMPPLVMAQHLGNNLFQETQFALLQPDDLLQKRMDQMRVQRYAAVNSKEYEAIAQMFNAVVQANCKL